MLNVPLNVRLSTANGDKHVTRRLRDLTFRSVVPGGYASATLGLDQPLATTDPAVGLYGKVYIYDGRSGATVWEGRQEDPGRGANGDGQTWTLQAFGPAAHAGDAQITVCYVDNGIESFQPASNALQTRQVSSTDDSPPKLLIALNNGTVMGAGVSAQAVSRLLSDCGQKLARFKATWDVGVTDANFLVQIVSRPGINGARTILKTAAFNIAGGTISAVITTDIPVGDDCGEFDIRNNGAATTIAVETYWARAATILQGTRYTAAGVEQTTGATYSADTVLASDVVADLLGRVLTQYDGANATIATTSYAIDRLVYPDPTPPQQILDDLMQLESAYYWAAWESTSAGKARFVWQAWPTTVRYETSIVGAFDSPGAAGDLYNRCLVRYRDKNGRTRSVLRSLAQADLDNNGLVRTYPLDLGDNIGSAANAAQAGDRFLADHNSPPNAGTLEITTPVLDLVAGRLVQPWEVQPGNLIRVRGVLPRVDALNATDRDAITVFRMLSTEYKATTNSCSVELDSYSRSIENQILAAHQRISKTRKR